jgi:predicted MFS family arabinose efflux permease
LRGHLRGLLVVGITMWIDDGCMHQRVCKGGRMNSRVMIVMLFVVAAFSNLSGLSLYPFLSSIAEEFGSSVAMIGQAITISLIGGAIVGLVAGPLADHYGQRRLIILGTLLMSLSGIGTAMATSYEWLLIARFPAGLATGILLGISLSLATTRLVGDERRSAVGWIASGSALGAVVGPPFMTALADIGTWRTGFWFHAVAPLLLAFFCFRVLPVDITRPASPFSLRKTISSYQDVLADRRSLLLQCGMLFWAVPVLAGSGYLGAYLIQNHGFTLSGAGFGYMWAASWLMIGSRMGIRLLKYLELYRLIMVSSLVMAVASTVLFWMPLGMPWILVFMMVWTLNMGVGTPAITNAISEAARTGQGTAMMARQFTWTSGGALGAALGGGLIAVGGYALFGFVIGLACLVVIGMVILATRPYPPLSVPNTEALAGE